MMLETLIFSLAEWALLAIGIWWIVGFILWRIALQGRRSTLGAVARRLAPRLALPGARRLATVTAAASLAVLPACTSGPKTPQLTYVGEAGPDPIDSTAPPTTAPPTTRPTTAPPSSTRTPDTHMPATTTATTTPATTTPATAPQTSEPSGEASVAIEPSRPLTHDVRPGEHLWGIATAQLTSTIGAEPTNREIVAYWRRLIAANAATIRSGDPNLIYPGEPLTLPEIELERASAPQGNAPGTAAG